MDTSTHPAPPFVIGQRIRCRGSTRGRPAGSLGHLPELLGRAGTIVGVEWVARWSGVADHRRITVEYDHLGRMTLPCNPIQHNDATELVPIEEWGAKREG